MHEAFSAVWRWIRLGCHKSWIRVCTRGWFLKPELELERRLTDLEGLLVGDDEGDGEGFPIMRVVDMPRKANIG